MIPRSERSWGQRRHLRQVACLNKRWSVLPQREVQALSFEYPSSVYPPQAPVDESSQKELADPRRCSCERSMWPDGFGQLAPPQARGTKSYAKVYKVVRMGWATGYSVSSFFFYVLMLGSLPSCLTAFLE